MQKEFKMHEINVRKTKIVPDNYVGITEECIVQFLPGQPIRAICTGLQIDVLGRFTYDLELILMDPNTSEQDLDEVDSTYIYGVHPAFVSPISATR